MTGAFKNIKIENAQPQGEDWKILLKRQALMSLPKFSGSAKEWPKFKKVFQDTTEEGKFTHLENLNRLQQVLEGHAMKSVSQLMIDERSQHNGKAGV